MKLALILTLALVGVAAAHPAKKSLQKEGRHEIVLHSSRAKSLLSGRPSAVGRVAGGSPHVFVRSPRYYEPQYYALQGPNAWVSPRGRAYAVYPKTPSKWAKRQRDDDDDDDEEDDEDDDEDEEDEEEQDELETPTWDEMFPPEEQGDYGQAQKNPSFGLRRNEYVAVPAQQEYSTGEVVSLPAGRGRHALYQQVQQPRRRRVTNQPFSAFRVVSPRQYNFDVGAPRRQNYYVGGSSSSNRRTSSWNPFSYAAVQREEPSSEESRRPWGPPTGPVFHFQEGQGNSGRVSAYPSGYQGRSNSHQGRRNNRIPVFYSH